MSCCEKCWEEAKRKHLSDPRKSQTYYYHNIMAEKELSDSVCSLKEQAGQFWDEVNQCDTRKREQKMPKKIGTEEQEATRRAIKKIIREKDILEKTRDKALAEINEMPGDSFASIGLGAAFRWSKTPSGHGFWSDIYYAPDKKKVR